MNLGGLQLDLCFFFFFLLCAVPIPTYKYPIHHTVIDAHKVTVDAYKPEIEMTESFFCN